MSVNLEVITAKLKEKFPNAEILIEDTKGDGYHFDLQIIDEAFEEVPNVQRHKMVYDTLGTWVGNEIHALSITAITPDEIKTQDSAKLDNIKTDKPLHNDILLKIDEAVNKYDVILFMKGEKSAPMCGFSSTVNSVLLEYGVDFMDVNVLASNELRENIKIYSNWPTIPQLYVKGQFIGGCDIVLDMHNNGSLKELLEKYNLIK